MRSRMTPEQLAKVKGGSERANALHDLATMANGHGVTAADRRKAQAALEAQVGGRKAKNLKEAALQRAGAKPKGLGRLFG